MMSASVVTPVFRPSSDSRYRQLMTIGTEADPKAGETKEYAEFLREQERRCGPDGFLDSNKYTHSFHVRGKVLRSTPGPAGEDRPTTSQLELPRPGYKAKSPELKGGHEELATVVDLVNSIREEEKGFEKKMKVIEDNMWLHRQDERDLKRSEGDVLKAQQVLKRTMRDYELAINQKKLSEEKNILDSKQKEFLILNQIAHKKEEMTKDGIEKSLDREQQEKDDSRRVFLSMGDLERKYQSKMSEIDLRRSEVQMLSEQFVESMRRKENETDRLSRELAELALSISMEVKKKQTQDQKFKSNTCDDSEDRRKKGLGVERSLNEKLRKNQRHASHSETNRRSVSAEADRSKIYQGEKLRQEGRHLLDMRNQLSANSLTQRKLQDREQEAKQDWTIKQIEHKLQTHDARKQKRLHVISQTKHSEHEESVVQWRERFSVRQLESSRKENEDTMKHATRAVTKLEETEYNLSNRVRDAELDRKQREQLCKRMTHKLFDMRRRNAARLKKNMVDMRQQEKQLEHKILREQSFLFKSHVNREEGYLSLQQHRVKVKEDKFILEEASREHQRLLRIGEKTDNLSSYA